MIKLSNLPMRSVCPLACTLDILGDRWTLLVVRDLMVGKQFFKDFEGSPEGIATNILSNRLGKLVDWGLVEKVPSSGTSGRSSYQLTDFGESLRPVVAAIADWGLSHIEGTEKRVGAG